MRFSVFSSAIRENAFKAPGYQTIHETAGTMKTLRSDEVLFTAFQRFQFKCGARVVVKLFAVSERICYGGFE